MINKYPLNENSKSLKLATEPPENPILKEKRDANLPKPSHKSLHWEIKLGLRGGNRASRKKFRARDTCQGSSEPHRCLTWASAARGTWRPPANLRPAEKGASPPQATGAVPRRRGGNSNPDTKEGGSLGMWLLPSGCTCSRAGAGRHSRFRYCGYFKSSRVADRSDTSPPAPILLPHRNKGSLSALGPRSIQNPPAGPAGTSRPRARK